MTGRLNPPKFLFLQTNQRCNLLCAHCHYWKKSDSDSANYLTLARRRELMSEFKELGGQVVVTCGGEPMLDLEPYFDLCSGARSSGLKLFSVVNGTRVSTQPIAERMILEGPSEITISLDHWLPEEHDRLRGVKGSFFAAVRAIKLLVAARERLAMKVPIYAMTIVSEDTYPTLDRFYQFALELGADKLKLNIVQPSFQGHGPDEFFQHASVKDVEACLRIIRHCDSVFGISRNPQWLADVEMYLRSVSDCKSRLDGWASHRGTQEAICNSYDRNIMVDLYGNARLCFNTIFPSLPLESYGDLTRYWNEWSLPLRDCMVGCKQFCGISHSVRASESTLKNLPGEALMWPTMRGDR